MVLNPSLDQYINKTLYSLKRHGNNEEENNNIPS